MVDQAASLQGEICCHPTRSQAAVLASKEVLIIIPTSQALVAPPSAVNRQQIRPVKMAPF